MTGFTLTTLFMALAGKRGAGRAERDGSRPIGPELMPIDLAEVRRHTGLRRYDVLSDVGRYRRAA